MKVMKEKSREYNGKPYFKYKINLPEQKLQEAGIKEGDDLSVEAKKGELKLRKKQI
ncbi:MAG: hypothetical protein Q7R87_01565 [Nanoarchaeota archaeon]|nr:hypothetical protein [Nanoarchaeota archaeon]